MKTISELSVISLLFLCLLGCTDSTSKVKDASTKCSYEEIKIPESATDTLHLSTIASEIKYMPLETKSNHLVSEIKKIVFADNKIFINDTKTNSLFIFSSDGKFVFQNDKVGKGPEEHVVITDFLIDEKNSTIEILDPGNRKLLIVDYNGLLVSNSKYPFSAKYFGKFDNGEYVFFYNNTSISSPHDNISILNKRLKTVDSRLPIRKEVKNIPFSSFNMMVKYKDGFNMAISFCDTIYYVTETEVRKKYLIDFGKLKIPAKYYNSLKKSTSKGPMFILKTIREIGSKYSSYIQNVLENENIFIFQYRSKGKFFTVIYNKSTKHIIQTQNVFNDLDYGLFGKPIGISEHGELVTLIYPYDLLEHLENLDENHNNFEKLKTGKMKELIKMTSVMKDMDNPILMFVKLKEQ